VSISHMFGDLLHNGGNTRSSNDGWGVVDKGVVVDNGSNLDNSGGGLDNNGSLHDSGGKELLGVSVWGVVVAVGILVGILVAVVSVGVLVGVQAVVAVRVVRVVPVRVVGIVVGVKGVVGSGAGVVTVVVSFSFGFGFRLCLSLTFGQAMVLQGADGTTRWGGTIMRGIRAKLRHSRVVDNGGNGSHRGGRGKWCVVDKGELLMVVEHGGGRGDGSGGHG
jgi:hypothetical protein